MDGKIKKLLKKYPASQNPYEFEKLVEKVREINPKYIVEIGVHQGYCLAIFKKLFPNAVCIGIDNDLHALDKEATKDCIIIDGDSHRSTGFAAIMAALGYKKIDFLFIDGDHSRNGVSTDYKWYGEQVREGGIIGFHDVDIKDNPTVEVYKFWDELAESNKNAVKHVGKNGTGTGILNV